MLKVYRQDKPQGEVESQMYFHKRIAVSVSCSALAYGLASQDAFAWDVLTNRLYLLDTSAISGDDGYVDPPVPIPNTVVKHINAESTWLETAWEDRKLPVRVKSHFVLR